MRIERKAFIKGFFKGTKMPVKTGAKYKKYIKII
jgi:hypothetical protein